MTFIPNFLPTLNRIREATGCSEDTARLAYARVGHTGTIDAYVAAAELEIAISRATEAGVNVHGLLVAMTEAQISHN